jgi:acetyl esterase
MTVDNLDPVVRSFLDGLKESDRPAIETLPPPEARILAADGLKDVACAFEPVAHVEDALIPGPGGSIPVRIYAEDSPKPRPCLVYFHGGGWVLCGLDTHDTVCRAIARRSGGVVVSVDYRLAPEHKYPAALEDCYAATQWVAENATRLGIDPQRIAVGGDSAGGNLAAATCLKGRDEGGVKPALQVLVYPVTNLASFDTDSYRNFAEGYFLTASEMEWFRASYLCRPEDASDPYASPLLAPDLRGLPPALVITAECDVLRDEGEAYAQRLEQAGVPVVATRYPGMIHPFFSMAGALEQGRAAIEQVAAAVREAK